jgi:hypothetical protein
VDRRRGFKRAPSLTVLYYSWNFRQMAGRPFPYTRITALSEASLALLSQTDLSSSTVAHLFTSLSPDGRGHSAWSTAGTAVQTPTATSRASASASWTTSVRSRTWRSASPAQGLARCLSFDGPLRRGDFNTARGWYTGDGIWTVTSFMRKNNNPVACDAPAAMKIKNIVFGRGRNVNAYNRWAGA